MEIQRLISELQWKWMCHLIPTFRFSLETNVRPLKVTGNKLKAGHISTYLLIQIVIFICAILKASSKFFVYNNV